MKIRMLGLAAGFVVLAATPAFASPGGPETARAALLEVDAEFSRAAQTVGIAEAFVRYADPDATMMPEDRNPVTGEDAIRKQFAGMMPGTTLVWKPFKADASASGDLGYTLGTYELRGAGKDGKPTVHYGKYCSVWKKQKDGSWKWVVDIGNASPAP